MRLPREVALQLIGGFNVPHVDEIVVDASSGHQQRRVAFAVRHTEGMTNFVRTHQLANAAGELVFDEAQDSACLLYTSRCV